mgnify:CR=1 FL=1
MRFLNLTPHPIVVVGGPTIPPSGTVARCATVSRSAGEHQGVALVRATFGEVVDLPDPEEGVLLVVSALVRAAVPHRGDVASPGDLVRDGSGAVIGCRNLVVN